MRRGERWATELCITLMVAGCAGKVTDLGGKPDVGKGQAGAGGATVSDGAGGTGQAGKGAGGQSGASHDGGVAGSAPDVPDPPPTVKRSKKLDLLLMVDNSSSMADKQKVLNDTIPDLVQRLTAASPGVTDLHVAVISSSLGDHGGGSTCVGHDATGNSPTDLRDQEQNDHAHLITTRPRAAGLGLPDVISWNSTEDKATLTKQIQDVVGVVGEFGCGLEAQLESVYRFLVDPVPPAAIIQIACPEVPSQKCVGPTGLDTALLAQRAEFLRPDSAVAVLVLTDENDCSIRDEKQYFYAATNPSSIRLPRGSAACSTNPNDPCCHSCGSIAPANCPVDLTCASPNNPNSTSDNIGLRCFHEKERFGMDFLYPIQRYVTALTRAHLCLSRPDLQPTLGCSAADLKDNPLFIGADGSVRSPALVSMLGLVGVPWQDLAAPGAPPNELQFEAPAALAVDGKWDAVLGDPAASPPRAPTDGLMVESVSPRSGNDINGKPIPGPQAPSSAYNSINHHEWADVAQADLEYACIFALPESRNCTTVEAASVYASCDCGVSNDVGDNNPLCQSPTDGTYGSLQYYAKGYPATRELSLLQAMGGQGLTASICPRNLTDDTASDYGYRPAIDLLINQLIKTTP